MKRVELERLENPLDKLLRAEDSKKTDGNTTRNVNNKPSVISIRPFD